MNFDNSNNLINDNINLGFDDNLNSTGNYSENYESDSNVKNNGAKILVIGVGGAGSNTITRLFEMNMNEINSIAMNTDLNHLNITKANKKILIGKEITKGLGAGGFPEVGRKAAEENRSEIKQLLKDTDMIFLVGGLGGGTYTGAAPMIAEIAKSMGIIIIAMVTMPFKTEGTRISKAEDGLMALREVCDTIIVVENDKLLKLAGNLPLKQAFDVANELVATTIEGITNTISLPSLVNLDFADVKTVMNSGGVATIGIGRSNSDERAKEAIQKALNNQLLQVDYSGATGALIHITGGEDLKLNEIDYVGKYVSQNLDPQSQVIWGARINPLYNGKIQVITIITGIKSPYILGPTNKTTEPKKELSKHLEIDVIKF